MIMKRNSEKLTIPNQYLSLLHFGVQKTIYGFFNNRIWLSPAYLLHRLYTFPVSLYPSEEVRGYL